MKLKDVKIVESAETTLSTRPAQKLTFTYSTSGIKMGNMRVWTIYAGRVFHVTYAARIDDFSVGLPAIEKMIDSFQITRTTSTEANETQLKDNNFLVYEHKNPYVKIDYPSEWIADEILRGEQLFRVDLLSPAESNSELYEERLVVEIKSLHSDATLDDYTHDYISNQLMKKIPKSLKFKLLESTNTTIADILAKKVIYKTISTIGDEIRTMEIFATKDGMLYTITFGNELSKFHYYLPTVQKIIESIEFHIPDIAV